MPPPLRLNSVRQSLDTSTSPEEERKKGRKRRIHTKPKNPQKNAREKKRVEAVATTYKQLRTALGADENRRRTTKVKSMFCSLLLVCPFVNIQVIYTVTVILCMHEQTLQNNEQTPRATITVLRCMKKHRGKYCFISCFLKTLA